MIFFKNYIASNWGIDTICVIFSGFMLVFAFRNDDSSRWLILFPLLVLLFVGIKMIYFLWKLEKIKAKIKLLNIADPQPVDLKFYREFNFTIHNDSKALDIFEGRYLYRSVSKPVSEKASILLLISTGWNWNWKYADKDFYYQILYLEKGETVELLRVRRVWYHQKLDTDSIENLFNLANEIAYKLNVKIRPILDAEDI